MVQDRGLTNLSAGCGVAVREFKLASGYGYANYLLFVDGKAVGVVEAKPEGHTLTGVEIQVARYAAGLPPGLSRLSSPFLSCTRARGRSRGSPTSWISTHGAVRSSRSTDRRPWPSGCRPTRSGSGSRSGCPPRRWPSSRRRVGSTGPSPRRSGPGSRSCRRWSSPISGRTRSRPSGT
jgi:hypothetical protein